MKSCKSIFNLSYLFKYTKKIKYNHLIFYWVIQIKNHFLLDGPDQKYWDLGPQRHWWERDKGQRTRLQFEATNSGLNQPNVAINEKEGFGSRIATRAVIIIDIGGRVRRLLEQPSREEIKKNNN